MSIGDRAYRIMKGYVTREWDRIQGLDRLAAEEELQAAMEGQATRQRPVSDETLETEFLADRQEQARKLLGVPPEAGFREVRQAFERLNRRADPRNFPPGSLEALKAADLQRRVQWAYQTLTENVDTTAKRFGSLEID